VMSEDFSGTAVTVHWTNCHDRCSSLEGEQVAVLRLNLTFTLHVTIEA
jgi:hypothetical protein